jgi:hypothetical protein
MIPNGSPEVRVLPTRTLLAAALAAASFAPAACKARRVGTSASLDTIAPAGLPPYEQVLPRLLELGYEDARFVQRLYAKRPDIVAHILQAQGDDGKPYKVYRGVSGRVVYSPTYRDGVFSSPDRGIFTAVDVRYAMNYGRPGTYPGVVMELLVPRFMATVRAPLQSAGFIDGTEVMIPLDGFPDDRDLMRRLGTVTTGTYNPRDRNDPDIIVWHEFDEAYDAQGKFLLWEQPQQ